MADDEIWSYRSNDKLRVTAVEGLPPVDPSQVDVPKLMLEAKARVAAARGPRLWRSLFARLDAVSRLSKKAQ